MMVRSSRISTSLLAAATLLMSCGPDQTNNGTNNTVVVINNVGGSNNTTANNVNNPTNNTNCPTGQRYNPVTATCETSSPNNTTGNNQNNETTGINDSCPPEARPVYLVEADVVNPSAQGKLVRFDPQDRQFTEIGQLNCPVGNGETPFSMSVDRDATAWVLYSDGSLYEVSTTDASCSATTFQTGQSGYDVFGMGFVLNNPNNEDETLYVAGGSGPGEGSPRIGYITFPGLMLTDAASLSGWPEMSGTAAAELWAFFPSPLDGNARVSRIVPATGEEFDTIDVSSVITGNPNAWAFAHWGGRFYLFYKSLLDDSSNVFEVTRDGGVEEIIPDTGRYIVGAGVSTCAPLVIL